MGAMLKANPIIAFVATTNPVRAREFYANTLGLRFVSENQFAVVFDAGGIMLRVTPVQSFQPAGYTVLGWVVEDIAKEVRKLAKRGVKFRRYDWMEQDKDGVWTSPDNAKVAWFNDPDGNILSLTEFGRRKKSRKRARSMK
jgi:catechol 2,3-dioxygenase-like lactoylglutathione lyase family enzyme